MAASAHYVFGVLEIIKQLADYPVLMFPCWVATILSMKSMELVCCIYNLQTKEHLLER